MKPSPEAAAQLLQAMIKEELRRGRYGIIGLDKAMFEEICGLLGARNELFWVRGDFDPPNVQFDFNGLWFDAPFGLLRY